MWQFVAIGVLFCGLILYLGLRSTWAENVDQKNSSKLDKKAAKLFRSSSKNPSIAFVLAVLIGLLVWTIIYFAKSSSDTRKMMMVGLIILGLAVAIMLSGGKKLRND